MPAPDRGPEGRVTGTLGRHALETLRIGLPLAAAQLAQMAMGVTDTIMLGRLGAEALAAGGLGTSLEFTVLIVLQGVVSAVAVFVAQARGAGDPARTPALFWTAALLTLLLSMPAFGLLSVVDPLLRAVGQPEALVRDTAAFVDTMRWCVPGAMLGMGLLRAFLPAIDAGWIILPVMLAATVINALLAYGLIHGLWGLPELGLRGPAMATVIVSTAVALALAGATAGSAPRRALVRWSPPTLALLARLWRMGLPIGATFAVETGLFAAVALLIGRQGPVALAAQQVAYTMVGVCFMIPLGISQAANVRVGQFVGAGNRLAARRAGLVAIALASAVEAAAALVSWRLPDRVVTLFLDPADVEATATAVSLLGIAALFQVGDGIQCAAAGALRGLGDATIPFLLAATGYWIIGFPAAFALTEIAGMGPEGAWWGLAAGLTVTAALLTTRFLRRTNRPIDLA